MRISGDTHHFPPMRGCSMPPPEPIIAPHHFPPMRGLSMPPPKPIIAPHHFPPMRGVSVPYPEEGKGYRVNCYV
jgi:hypothetical protein